MDAFLDVAQQLRTGTWDIVEDWLAETKFGEAHSENALIPSADIIDELPTLIGGIAKVVQDPIYLMDLESGGSLNLVCQQFGRLRHETGFQIDQLLRDFSLLRQKLTFFCAQSVNPENTDVFELSRRLNMAVDMITAASIEAYYFRSSAELIELAQRDKLTGFLHLKAFSRVLDSELARSKRYHHGLALISADIDNFRQFNLEEGRLEGNQLLRDISREILTVVRTTDHTARLSGDEFAVIMPQTSTDEARHAAERIRRQVRQLRRDDRPATVSLGIASFPENADTKSTLIEKARQVMAQARNSGGDVIRWQALE